MDEAYKKKIQKLKTAILEYLAANGRHYGDLSREEQGVEDLAQALNTRLDQLLLWVQSGCEDISSEETPAQRLANAFLEAGALLSRGGTVDAETADSFENAIDLLDKASDFRRKAASVQDKAESAIIKQKRGQGS